MVVSIADDVDHFYSFYDPKFKFRVLQEIQAKKLFPLVVRW
jgi:hypothetical protein